MTVSSLLRIESHVRVKRLLSNHKLLASKVATGYTKLLDYEG